MTKHAEGAGGTRGIGQNVVNKLESKCLRITNDAIRASQEVLATTSSTSRLDPDSYINELTQLRSILNGMEEPVADRHSTAIVLQGLTEEPRNLRQIT